MPTQWYNVIADLPSPPPPPLHPGTHFSFSLVQSWMRQIAGHEVLVERTRPLLFAGFRPQRLRVLVDGVQVAEQEGM